MPGVDGREHCEPEPEDFAQWHDLVAAGAEPGDAARELGFNGSSTFGRADPDRHRDVIDLWHDLRKTKAAKTGMSTLVEVAEDAGAPHAARVSAANTLVKIGGLLVERTELTGADGAPIQHHVDLGKLDDAELQQLRGLVAKTRDA